MLANLILFNLWSCSVIHLTTLAFDQYMAQTTANMIFNVLINNSIPFKVIFWYNLGLCVQVV